MDTCVDNLDKDVHFKMGFAEEFIVGIELPTPVQINQWEMKSFPISSGLGEKYFCLVCV